MVKHQWLLQFCGKYFYGELQTTIEWMNVGYPTLACLWVHHNVSTLKSRANKMPNACMPPKARRRRRKSSSRSNNRRDLNPKPKLKKGVRFWKQKREREKDFQTGRNPTTSAKEKRSAWNYTQKKKCSARKVSTFHSIKWSTLMYVQSINRSIILPFVSSYLSRLEDSFETPFPQSSRGPCLAFTCFFYFFFKLLHLINASLDSSAFMNERNGR